MGQERLQLWFRTPNLCGCILATIFISTAVFLISLSFNFSCKKNKKLCLSFSLLFLFAIFIQVLIIDTYSRGAYIACIICLIFIGIITRRKMAIIMLSLFICNIFLQTNGYKRLVSTINISSDDSIHNRLLLWKGGCGIITNAPWGIHDFTPGEYYTAFYQPLWLQEEYRTLINDFLNIPIQIGLFLFFLYLFFFIFLFCVSIQQYIQAPQTYNLLSTSCLLCIFICSFFSSMLNEDISILSLFIFFTAILVISSIPKISKKNFYSLRFALFGAVFICASILVIGYNENQNLKIDYSYSKENKSFTIKSKTKIKANLIYFIHGKKELARLCWNHIRLLSEQGHQIKIIPIVSGQAGIIQILNVCSKEQEPFFIAGFAESARSTFIAAAKMKEHNLRGLIVLAMPVYWPIKNLSPNNYISKMKFPVLLIYGSNDHKNDLTEITNFYNFGLAHKCKFKLKIISNSDYWFNDKRTNLVKTIDNFIMNEEIYESSSNTKSQL